MFTANVCDDVLNLLALATLGDKTWSFIYIGDVHCKCLWWCLKRTCLGYLGWQDMKFHLDRWSSPAKNVHDYAIILLALATLFDITWNCIYTWEVQDKQKCLQLSSSLTCLVYLGWHNSKMYLKRLSSLQKCLKLCHGITWYLRLGSVQKCLQFCHNFICLGFLGWCDTNRIN